MKSKKKSNKNKPKIKSKKKPKVKSKKDSFLNSPTSLTTDKPLNLKTETVGVPTFTYDADKLNITYDADKLNINESLNSTAATTASCIGEEEVVFHIDGICNDSACHNEICRMEIFLKHQEEPDLDCSWLDSFMKFFGFRRNKK